MEDIKISIIIPAYNSGKYLNNMFESLKKQTFKDFEIIAVNDGSTDDTAKNLESQKEFFKDYIIINQNNSGSYKARINGIKLARGKYTIVLDADDTLQDTFLEELYNSIKTNNSDVAICGFKRIEFETNKVFSTEMCKHKEEVIDINLFSEKMLEINTSLWNKLFKTSVLKTTQDFKNIPYALDDMAFLAAIYLNVSKISFVDKALYNYYVHENSVITSITEEKISAAKETLLEIREEYENKKVSESRIEVLSCMVFVHLIISMLYRIYFSVDKKTFKKIKKELDDYININFPEYKKAKFLKVHYSIFNKFSNIKIIIMKTIYKMNLFTLFLKFYYFIITKLKIDIKW